MYSTERLNIVRQGTSFFFGVGLDGMMVLIGGICFSMLVS
jgi:hypothetical protein